MTVIIVHRIYYNIPILYNTGFIKLSYILFEPYRCFRKYGPVFFICIYNIISTIIAESLNRSSCNYIVLAFKQKTNRIKSGPFLEFVIDRYYVKLIPPILAYANKIIYNLKKKNVYGIDCLSVFSYGCKCWERFLSYLIALKWWWKNDTDV